MKAFVCLAVVSVALAACGFHSETVVEKRTPSTAVVVPNNPPPPPPTTVYVPSRY
ncbi:hypothetical protein [Enhydrobacter sp.]|jgi:hypothetical protein|uniref:hypothetical protein n=1 Tax=Enhydrobacter sp. TaxID=1894999 RepID=UPI0026113F0A|nr:hypothetical protein [Enhydrobacter sp.]WIM14416.1 MAG: hypothetical protein OJF58_005386 [Enhydrobacter sp.]